MKYLFAFITILMVLGLSGGSHAKLKCGTDDSVVTVDPDRKRVEITRDGKKHRFKILNPANHGFKLFGETSAAYEVEGGIVVGIKDTSDAKKKNLSVFKRGEVIASYEGCSEK